MVVLAVSFITLIAALICRRLISRPGGFSSGLLLGLPLLLPLLAAIVYQRAVLPEVAVLRPVGDALLEKPTELLHLLFLSDGGARVTPYALSGSAGPWIFLVGASVTSFMLIRRFAGTLVLRRLIGRCRPLEHHGILAAVRRLAAEAGLKAPPAVLLLPEGVSGAFAAGGRGGRVLISTDLIAALDCHELEAILAHEIAHLEARDVPVVFAAGLLRDLVAWNPVAHLAFRRLLTDRELEADRRASLMTGHPLFLASGLLKVFELMKSRRGVSQRAALALLRPRGRVKRRVTHLLALADGRMAGGPVGRSAYLAAACLVAVLGLQVGARVASQDSAFAIVWGGGDSEKAIVYDPSEETRALRDLRQAQARKSERGKTPVTDGRLERLLKTPGPLTVRATDLGAYARNLNRMANRLGIPVSILQWEARPMPLLGERSFGVYRIDRHLLEATLAK